MQLTTILLTISCLQVAANGMSQYVTFSGSNVKLEKVFKSIEEQTGYFVFYEQNLFNDTKPITINAKNVLLNEFLKKILKDQPFIYYIRNTTIFVRAKHSSFNSTFAVEALPPPPIEVRGRVVDENGDPISVTISVKGTNKSTFTDAKGEFVLHDIEDDAILVISGVAIEDLEIKVRGRINLQTIRTTKKVDEGDVVVVVGYGVQKRINMTGAVASVKGDVLKKVNVANVSNSIGGQISGIITKQNGGEPGDDFAQVFLRGTTPLVLVDGIERDWNRTNMEDVESITVLKDASAVAPYGLRGANGVILITTKRGKEGKITLTYAGMYGWQKPTNTPDFMSAADGLRLRNKALIMDGQPNAVITPDVLEQYEVGTDAYPNTDWVKNYLETSATTRHNVSISGGSKTTRAFVSLGYFDQGSMLGKGSGYGRFNVRSNLDMKATKTTEISLDFSMVSDKKETTYGNADDVMLNVYRLRATEPDIYSNGLPAFQSSIGWSMNGLVHGGSERRTTNDFQNLGIMLKQELPFIKGLSFKANLNYDKSTYAYKYWREPHISYKYDAATGEYIEDNAWLRSKPELSQGNRTAAYYTTQSYFNYENQFGKHGVQALAVYERRWGGSNEFNAARSQYDVNIHELSLGSPNKENQENSGTSSESAQDGVIFRGSYNFNQKYLFEVAGRYDRSYRYAPGRRTAFFPSASVGWRLSEENFIKNNISAIDNLKLRASYGKSGNPVGDQFAYLTKYLVRNTYVWGLDPIQEQGVYEGSEPNTLLTWETVWKANLGLELSMWKGRLGMELDVYRDFRRDKILAPDAIVPEEYGIGLSDENAGKEERYGVDLTLTNNTRISTDFSIRNSFVFGFTRNRLIEIREAPGTYNVPRFRRTGQPSGQLRGYRSEGLFKDQEDIDNWAYQGSVLPGDIKYTDINGDGKINSEDRVIIGKTSVPEIMYGYNLTTRFKRFDLNLFIQGTGNSCYYLGYGADGAADRGVRYPFDNDKPLKDHINSWTEDNPDVNAPYPRLSTSKRSQNYQISDYWIRNTSYVRLKTIDIGYTFNSSLTQKAFMKSVRAYLNFYNVWTIYSLMPKDFDSENQSYDSYPQQFITSVGLNITF